MIARVIKPFIWVAVLAGIWQTGEAGWIHAKAWLAQHLLQGAWEITLQDHVEARPWPWADTWPVAELSVPGLGIKQIVLEGDSGRTMAFGPGRTSGSALPGRQGVTVISGHRDTHFRFLQNLSEGDIVWLTTIDGTFSYVVRELAVVDQRRFRVNTETQQAALMLVTCFPFDAIRPGGPERLVVLADRIEADEALASSLDRAIRGDYI